MTLKKRKNGLFVNNYLKKIRIYFDGIGRETLTLIFYKNGILEETKIYSNERVKFFFYNIKKGKFESYLNSIKTFQIFEITIF